MFGTIIIDAYEQCEAQSLADAIDEICSPTDSYGWASAGIYSFWDYYSNEVLYIGLASDLKIRFMQHNGLIAIDANACKHSQIQEYFLAHEKLGYSIFVQSPLSQPVVQRNIEQYRNYLEIAKDQPIENYAGEEGIPQIKLAEGQLIEAYRIVKGDIPDWNKIGGNIHARKYATTGNYHQIVEAFTHQEMSNLLTSKSTIRELAENSTYEWFENQMHGLRMMMLTMGLSYAEALQIQLKYNPWFQGFLDSMIEERYDQKKLVV